MDCITTVEECVKYFTSRKNTKEAIEKLIEYRVQEALNSVT
jgi:hypothetical protein